MASTQMEHLKQTMQQMMAAGFVAKFDGSIDPQKLRDTIGMAQLRMPTEPGVMFEACTLGGVEAELSVPQNARKDAIIFYIHGGGLITGTALSSRGYASMLAGETSIPVYSISYRLAPEHPYPDGVADCFAAYQDILAKHPGLPVFLIGESGGAYLSIVTALKARDAGLPMPAGVIPYSPPLEFWGEIDRDRPNNQDFTVTPSGLIALGKMYYTDGSQRADPYATPSIADYHDFPPTYLVWDESESLAVDAELLRDKLVKAGCDLTVGSYPDCFHAFATSGRGTPESMEVLSNTVRFMNAHVETKQIPPQGEK